MKNKMNLEENLPKTTKPAAIGDDLYDFSVAELQQRIILFEQEVERIKQAHKQKSAGMSAANALFGKP
jgi:uncharacterized small protein (DUF1192 family)